MKALFLRALSGIIMAFVFIYAYFYCPPVLLSVLLSAILCFILIVEWPHFFPRSRWIPWILAPFYPIAPFIMIIVLNEDPDYNHLILYLFVMTAAFDLGSYIIGSLFGNHRIAPTFSPGKTWEGFIGGYFFAVISFFMITPFYHVSASFSFALFFAFIVAVAALVGDLFESALKRQASLKDSGSALPGHGGFLDRFDSVLVAVLIFYFLKNHLQYLR